MNPHYNELLESLKRATPVDQTTQNYDRVKEEGQKDEINVNSRNLTNSIFKGTGKLEETT